MPRCDRQAAIQCAPDGEVSLRQRGQLFPGQRGAVHVDDIAAQHRHLFGVAAVAGELHATHRGGDALAGAEGLRRVLQHFADGFDAGDAKAVDGAHLAGAEIGFGTVEAEGFDADTYFVTLRGGRGDIADLEDVGSAGLFDHIGFHVAGLLDVWARLRHGRRVDRERWAPLWRFIYGWSATGTGRGRKTLPITTRCGERPAGGRTIRDRRRPRNPSS